MNNLFYLFWAYTLLWAVLFGYVLYLIRKLSSLRDEIDSIKEKMKKD